MFSKVYFCLLFFFVFSCTPTGAKKNEESNIMKTQQVEQLSILEEQSSFVTKDLKVLEKVEETNRYLQIFFTRDPKATSVKYSICTEVGPCEEGYTIEEQVTYWEAFKGSYKVEIASCAKLLPDHTEPLCGSPIATSGVLDLSNNDPEIEALLQKKLLIEEKLEVSGPALIEVLQTYKQDVVACSKADSSFTPVISDEDFEKIKALDARDLGQAVRLLVNKLTESGDESGEEEEDEYDPTTDIVNLIFGITGVAAAVGIAVDTFAQQSKRNKMELERLRAERVGELKSGKLSSKFEASKAFTTRAKAALDAGKKVDVKSKFSDLSVRNKYKMIGVGAVGVALFGVMAGLSFGNMGAAAAAAADGSAEEENGFGLTGSSSSCAANNELQYKLEEIGIRLADLMGMIQEVELDLEILQL